MKYYIKTYGCQQNYSDTERLHTLLEALGFSESPVKEADLVVFNSCSVRQKAEDRVYGELRNMRKLRRERPELLVVLTGCMVRKTDAETKIKELDVAVKTEEMGKIGELIKRLRPGWDLAVDEGSLENYFEIHPKVSSRYQVFVPIMTGCNKFCTYCIVPYARGREKSRPHKEIIAECKKLVDAGAKEITLLGQTVDSYDDGDMNFPQLLQEIDKLEKLNRLRFTSPHPTDFSQELIETIAKLRTACPYIHLPVQSGSNSCLRRMNRPYTREKYLDIIRRIRKAIPNCAISTDVIVGFCGETEEEFEETYSLFEEIRFDMAYLARYSPRKGTFAAKKLEDDVPPEEKARRWHRLNDLLTATSLEKNQAQIGREVEVLVEQQDDELTGRTREFKEVHIKEFDKNHDWIGEIIPVKVTEAREWLLNGKIINKK